MKRRGSPEGTGRSPPDELSFLISNATTVVFRIECEETPGRRKADGFPQRTCLARTLRKANTNFAFMENGETLGDMPVRPSQIRNIFAIRRRTYGTRWCKSDTTKRNVADAGQISYWNRLSSSKSQESGVNKSGNLQRLKRVKGLKLIQQRSRILQALSWNRRSGLGQSKICRCKTFRFAAIIGTHSEV